MFKKLLILTVAFSLAGVVACGKGTNSAGDELTDTPDLFDRPGTVPTSPFIDVPTGGPDESPPPDGVSITRLRDYSCNQYTTSVLKTAKLEPVETENIEWNVAVAAESVSNIELVETSVEENIFRYKIKCNGHVEEDQIINFSATNTDDGRVYTGEIKVRIADVELRNTSELADGATEGEIQWPANEEKVAVTVAKSATGGSGDPANYEWNTNVFKIEKSIGGPLPQADEDVTIFAGSSAGDTTIEFSKTGRFRIETSVTDSVSDDSDVKKSFDIEIKDGVSAKAYVCSLNSRDDCEVPLFGEILSSTKIDVFQEAAVVVVDGHNHDNYYCKLDGPVTKTLPASQWGAAIEVELKMKKYETPYPAFLNVDDGLAGLKKIYCMVYPDINIRDPLILTRIAEANLTFDTINLTVGGPGVQIEFVIDTLTYTFDMANVPPFITAVATTEPVEDDAPGPDSDEPGVLADNGRVDAESLDPFYSKFTVVGGEAPYTWSVKADVDGIPDATGPGRFQDGIHPEDTDGANEAETIDREAWPWGFNVTKNDEDDSTFEMFGQVDFEDGRWPLNRPDVVEHFTITATDKNNRKAEFKFTLRVDKGEEVKTIRVKTKTSRHDYAGTDSSMGIMICTASDFRLSSCFVYRSMNLPGEERDAGYLDSYTFDPIGDAFEDNSEFIPTTSANALYDADIRYFKIYTKSYTSAWLLQAIKLEVSSESESESEERDYRLLYVNHPLRWLFISDRRPEYATRTLSLPFGLRDQAVLVKLTTSDEGDDPGIVQDPLVEAMMDYYTRIMRMKFTVKDGVSNIGNMLFECNGESCFSESGNSTFLSLYFAAYGGGCGTYEGINPFDDCHDELPYQNWRPGLTTSYGDYIFNHSPLTNEFKIVHEGDDGWRGSADVYMYNPKKPRECKYYKHSGEDVVLDSDSDHDQTSDPTGVNESDSATCGQLEEIGDGSVSGMDKALSDYL